MAFISEPRRPNLVLRLGTWIAERITGRRMEPARVLGWYPRAAVSSGVMESLVAHGEPSERILKLVRIAASETTTCPFCIDMNSAAYDTVGLTDAEVDALLAGAQVPTLTPRERVAVEYARAISATPLRFPSALIDELTQRFSEREVVILATTAAQVNYWARTIQALGVPPAGFGSARPPRGGTAAG
ncbi:MAG: carboxymuconolactone decarboxylase family protein [Arachnia sp.]